MKNNFVEEWKTVQDRWEEVPTTASGRTLDVTVAAIRFATVGAA